MRKDYKELISEAVRQGWRVEHDSKHIKLFAPDGKTIETLASTSNEQRGFRNAIAVMQRAGFVWKGR